MKRKFKASNITCHNCANTIKVTLEDSFGDVEVNLDVNPKEVIVDIKDDAALEEFKKEMEDIGFPIIEEVK